MYTTQRQVRECGRFCAEGEDYMPFEPRRLQQQHRKDRQFSLGAQNGHSSVARLSWWVRSIPNDHYRMAEQFREDECWRVIWYSCICNAIGVMTWRGGNPWWQFCCRQPSSWFPLPWGRPAAGARVRMNAKKREALVWQDFVKSSLQQHGLGAGMPIA